MYSKPLQTFFPISIAQILTVMSKLKRYLLRAGRMVVPPTPKAMISVMLVMVMATPACDW